MYKRPLERNYHEQWQIKQYHQDFDMDKYYHTKILGEAIAWLKYEIEQDWKMIGILENKDEAIIKRTIKHLHKKIDKAFNVQKEGKEGSIPQN